MPRRGGGQSRGRGAHQSTPRSKSTQATPAASEEVDHDVEATDTALVEWGMGIVEAMTVEDMEIFLDKLATEGPMNDKMACQQINWEAVAFGAYGGEECQAAWLFLTKSGKLPRTTKGKGKKVPIVKTKYTNVPVPPLTPQLLFIQKKLNKLNAPPTKEELLDLKAKLKKKWANMSDGKKSKWIDKCINQSQNYYNEMEEYKKKFPAYVAKDFKIGKRITKGELQIWETFKGKPPTPPLKAFDFFFNRFCMRPEHASLPIKKRKELARATWTNYDYYHKEMYRFHLRKMKLEYKGALAKYYEEIPSLMKPLLLETLPKKYKEWLLRSVDKGIDIPIPDEDTKNSIDASQILHEYSEGEMQTEDKVGESSVKMFKKRRHKIILRDEDVKVFPEDWYINSDSEQTQKKKKRKNKSVHVKEEMTEEDEGEPTVHVKDEPLEMDHGEQEDDFPFYHLYDPELHKDARVKIKKEKK